MNDGWMPFPKGADAAITWLTGGKLSDLDDEFPLGDGVADLTAWITCPYCGEDVELAVDPGGGAVQEYVEDCEVCCRPLQLTVAWDAEGSAHVTAATDDDA